MSKETKVKKQRNRCHNCKYASQTFKIGTKMTYLHCEHQKHIEGLENDTLTAWDTLREFWETCPDHELKHN